MNYSNSRGQMGFREGQEGVVGVFNTQTFPASITGDSRVFYVSPNHTQAVDAGNLGRDPQVPLATITRANALARSNMGDVILVAPNDGWQYGTMAAPQITETAIITKHGVRLVGVSPSSLGVYWGPALTTEFALTIHALDVYVEGFAFTNVIAALANANGIYVEWNGTTLWGENATINRCFFDEDIDIGIQLEFSWFSEIMNCLFDRSVDAGIWVDTGGSGSAFNHIHDNTFTDCADAMRLHDTADSSIFRNSIFNTDAQNGAACTDEGIDLTGGSSNQVYDNYFSCQLPVGVGDYDDLNTESGSDAWINNHCMNGDAITNPA